MANVFSFTGKLVVRGYGLGKGSVKAANKFVDEATTGGFIDSVTSLSYAENKAVGEVYGYDKTYSALTITNDAFQEWLVDPIVAVFEDSPTDILNGLTFPVYVRYVSNCRRLGQDDELILVNFKIKFPTAL